MKYEIIITGLLLLSNTAAAPPKINEGLLLHVRERRMVVVAEDTLAILTNAFHTADAAGALTKLVYSDQIIASLSTITKQKELPPNAAQFGILVQKGFADLTLQQKRAVMAPVLLAMDKIRIYLYPVVQKEMIRSGEALISVTLDAILALQIVHKAARVKRFIDREKKIVLAFEEIRNVKEIIKSFSNVKNGRKAMHKKIDQIVPGIRRTKDYMKTILRKEDVLTMKEDAELIEVGLPIYFYIRAWRLLVISFGTMPPQTLCDMPDYAKIRQYTEALTELEDMKRLRSYAHDEQQWNFNRAVRIEEKACIAQYHLVGRPVVNKPIEVVKEEEEKKPLNPKKVVKEEEIIWDKDLIVKPVPIKDEERASLKLVDADDEDDRDTEFDQIENELDRLDDIPKKKNTELSKKGKKTFDQKQDEYHNRGLSDFEWDPKKQAAFDKMRKQMEKKEKALANPGKSCFCNMC